MFNTPKSSHQNVLACSQTVCRRAHCAPAPPPRSHCIAIANHQVLLLYLSPAHDVSREAQHGISYGSTFGDIHGQVNGIWARAFGRSCKRGVPIVHKFRSHAHGLRVSAFSVPCAFRHGAVCAPPEGVHAV
eukprot:1319662-Pleurochrysis_carterae.AAC.2